MFVCVKPLSFGRGFLFFKIVLLKTQCKVYLTFRKTNLTKWKAKQTTTKANEYTSILKKWALE